MKTTAADRGVKMEMQRGTDPYNVSRNGPVREVWMTDEI